MTKPDAGIDALLLLDGESFVADAKGICWVKFEVKQVVASPERPHGLRYSLTLHDKDGTRLLGFDNAHPIHETSGPGARTFIEYDHKHSGKRIRFYPYTDAATLMADFWTEVEAILQKRSTP
jgi:hypothetical protein